MHSSNRELGFSDVGKLHISGRSANNINSGADLVITPIITDLNMGITGVDKHKLNRANNAVSGLRTVRNFGASVPATRFRGVIGSINVTVIKRGTALTPTSGLLCTLESIATAISDLPLVISDVVNGGLTTSSSYVILSIGANDNSFVGAIREDHRLTRTVIRVNRYTNGGIHTLVASVSQPLNGTVNGSFRMGRTVRALGNGKPSSLAKLYIVLTSRVLGLTRGNDLRRYHTRTLHIVGSNATLGAFTSVIRTRNNGER